MASTTILSDNGVSSGSAGLKSTAGNDGVLILQTTTSGGTATNAVYVDTSQNVGIGTNSPAYRLQLGGTGAIILGLDNASDSSGAGVAFLGANTRKNWFIGNQYNVDGGLEFTQSTANGGATFSSTPSMVIDTNGSLGVGTTTPSNYGKVGLVTAAGAGSGGPATAIANASLSLGGTATTGALAMGVDATSSYYSWIQATTTGNAYTYNLALQPVGGNVIIGANSTLSTEKLSVQTSVGTGYSNLYLKSTSTSYSGSFCNFTINTATSGAFEFLRMFTSTQEVVRISGNGNIGNLNNSYGAVSDIKLKENIVDTTPKLADLMQVRIVNYNLKENPEQKQIGVVAQELEQVFPSMIDELRDTDENGDEVGTTTKSVKYSVFVPMLIKAIQEQQALITTLTERITALEAK